MRLSDSIPNVCSMHMRSLLTRICKPDLHNEMHISCEFQQWEIAQGVCHELIPDMRRDSDADSTANTSLSADNIIDAYGDANGTLNATAVSAAALAILACTVRCTATASSDGMLQLCCV